MSVRLEVTGRRATLWLDRPGKRNALDETMLTALLAGAREVESHPDVAVVLVRSTSSAFCAGADLTEWRAPSSRDATRLALLGHQAIEALARLPQPSIAVLSGPVMGGGLELALACDLRVTTADARLALPEARLGNLPSWGGVPRLVAAVGQPRARQMLLTGREISGATATEWGLCVTSAPDEDALAEAAEHLAAEVAECDPTALALVKALLPPPPVNAPLEAAIAVHTAMLPGSAARKEALLSRRARRAPVAGPA